MNMPLGFYKSVIEKIAD